MKIPLQNVYFCVNRRTIQEFETKLLVLAIGSCLVCENKKNKRKIIYLAKSHLRISIYYRRVR